jgi:hypothetical protein
MNEVIYIVNGLAVITALIFWLLLDESGLCERVRLAIQANQITNPSFGSEP